MSKLTEPFSTKSYPSSLRDHPFYGLKLDKEQEYFRDQIYDPSKEIIFCNARAGTGKTTIAVATAILMCRYHIYDDIIYIVHSVGDAQGYLPGTITEKSSVLFEPLYQAIIRSNENPQRVINSESLSLQKLGESFITAITDTYLRGSNLGDGHKTIMILDEAQNYDEDSLRKTLTRACKTTKVIVIGHDGQIDLHNSKSSGFVRCMNHFEAKEDDRVSTCKLSINYRGFVSNVADESWEELKS